MPNITFVNMNAVVKLMATAMIALSVTSCQGNASVQNNKKIDIHQKLDGQNIIFRRILEQDFAAVNALLDAGVDVNIRGGLDVTPAAAAAASDSWRMVKLLAKRGARLDLVSRNNLSVVGSAKFAEKRINRAHPDGRALDDVIEILKQRGLW